MKYSFFLKKCHMTVTFFCYTYYWSELSDQHSYIFFIAGEVVGIPPLFIPFSPAFAGLFYCLLCFCRSAGPRIPEIGQPGENRVYSGCFICLCRPAGPRTPEIGQPGENRVISGYIICFCRSAGLRIPEIGQRVKTGFIRAILFVFADR